MLPAILNAHLTVLRSGGDEIAIDVGRERALARLEADRAQVGEQLVGAEREERPGARRRSDHRPRRRCRRRCRTTCRSRVRGGRRAPPRRTPTAARAPSCARSARASRPAAARPPCRAARRRGRARARASCRRTRRRRSQPSPAGPPTGTRPPATPRARVRRDHLWARVAGADVEPALGEPGRQQPDAARAVQDAAAVGEPGRERVHVAGGLQQRLVREELVDVRERVVRRHSRIQPSRVIVTR